MKRLIRLEIFFIFIICAGQLLDSKDLAAHPARCPFINVHVYADKQSDIPIVCKAVTDTISFMVKAGLDVQATFDIHLTDRLDGFPQ